MTDQDNKETLDLTIFIEDYLNDARDGFQEVFSALLALEKDRSRRELLDDLFRPIHTLKSSSAMIGFKHVAELANFLEDFIDRLRKQEIPLTRDAVDFMFEGAESLEALVKSHDDTMEESKLVGLKQKLSQFEQHEILANQGVIAINRDCIIQSFNQAAERMFGYSAAEVLGRNVNMLMPEPCRSSHDEYVANYLKSGHANAIGAGREVEGLRKDGATFPMELAISELKLKEQQLFIGIMRDITSRKLKKAVALRLEKTSTVRVSMNLLDALYNLVGELIINKNRIDNIAEGIERKELSAALAEMKRTIDMIQENVSTARMVPVGEIFQKFPKMVRDLAREKGKEIELFVDGSEIELDKGMIDALGEPLIHLLRNAVDHGICSPEERKQRQKQALGTIRLSAKRTESHIFIDVEDNGRGIDFAAMKSIAVRRGILKQEEAELLGERQVLALLFKPGFTSLEAATGVSGRGVGLDVVMTSAKKMGGTVEVATEKGFGTRFSLKLPLTTAIIQTLMVGVGEMIFAIPSDIVVETVDLKHEDIREIGQDRVLRLRSEVVPFLMLAELLNLPAAAAPESCTAIIIHKDGRFMAIGVEAVLDQMENIIKPFDPIAQQCKGFSGGIILGDGRVALLLDIPALVNLDALKEEEYRHE